MPATQTHKTSTHAALVIIGTGMAGVGLARALRRLGDQRSITLVSADSGDDYSKPLLSTGFAKGLKPNQLAQRSAAELGDELNAKMFIHTQVSALDVDNQFVLLKEGQRIGYDTLVLATGAAPRVPFNIASSVAPSCFTINDLDDYRRFHTALGHGPARVAIVGAGLVGCEFANDLYAGGHQVSIVAPERSLLPRLLPPPLGNALGDAFSEAGIHLHLDRSLHSIALSSDENTVLQLDNGDTVGADLVLMATGLAPRTMLAEAAGLNVLPSGIVVDRQLQTSHPNIYALGDTACVDGVNAMYVQPLQASAKALAATLSGTPTPVSFGAWPVVVKTPLLPVVAYPPATTPERWQIEGEGGDISALAENKDGRLIGFALTGGCVRRKVELSRAAPALLG
ncbi:MULTISPECIES: FAD-dependent oxidoreductase [unclassified Halomonas]|uniref:NAD(P)/FAD-dependent oxidoreductase n=1 Tax=unclassified Halomonas TaxID=2609666 RepID=UPI0007DA0712|nr:MULTISPECIES: FAD-dependent oxidoreductase [unclassified Halomonas]MBT2787572.1 FAD-dependent oxidoreductase [Halomonas sp. ISL-106]MBT2799045.1 FAD-dependent oxidoreductase [Halomonas sp. ISL-104]OAL61522.1 pyridine nucleotide-disulfide oxidoreductase [Halomonas sp. ALS9]